MMMTLIAATTSGIGIMMMCVPKVLHHFPDLSLVADSLQQAHPLETTTKDMLELVNAIR